MLDASDARGDAVPALWPTVYEALRSAILSHKLVPGTKLPEDEIGAVYSVSRTVVRTALHSLAHDRLVELAPKRGAFVAQPTTQEAQEVFEARALIEPPVARRAAEVAKPSDIKRLRQHLVEEHRAMAGGDERAATSLSAQFHVSIAEIAGQTVYTEYVKQLCSRSALIISLHWTRRDTCCEERAHNALVEAIALHRPEVAAERMLAHLADLLSGLDLRPPTQSQRSIAEILAEKPRRNRRR